MRFFYKTDKNNPKSCLIQKIVVPLQGKIKSKNYEKTSPFLFDMVGIYQHLCFRGSFD